MDYQALAYHYLSTPIIYHPGIILILSLCILSYIFVAWILPAHSTLLHIAPRASLATTLVSLWVLSSDLLVAHLYI